MNSEENHNLSGQKRGTNRSSVHNGSASEFHFGARRHLRSGARRLFTPSKTFLSPTFTPEAERARPTVRIISGSV
jgi:hypothetical protein